MLAPLSWLKEYVETKSTPEKLSERLLLAGNKVEALHKRGSGVIFEFEITPNRPDTLSVLGLAREIAAQENLDLKFPDTEALLPGKVVNSRVAFKVKDKKLCPHYSICKLTNVEVGDSPTWLKQFLELSGVRAINTVVDITNFVMLETGQPMHAFDARKIKGSLTLRGSKNGETVVTLDGIDRKLPEGSIVIEDQEKLVDLAGLMGGKNSEIEESTSEIILLVPVYNSVAVRKTSQFTNLRTEASNRFEKKLDPNMHVFAIERAVKLFTEQASAQLSSKIDSTPKVAEKTLTFPKNLIKQVIGIELTDSEVVNLLSPLEFIVQNSKLIEDTFEITVPSFRTDIEIAEDILEEIARMFGYNKLPKTLPSGVLPTNQEFESNRAEEKVRNLLLRTGYNESTGYTLVSKSDCERFGFPLNEVLKVKNPASSDFEYLRPTLLINSVRAIAANRSTEKVSFFEIAKVFEREMDKTRGLPKQPLKLGLVTTEPLDVFKGTLRELFNSFGLTVSESKSKSPFFASSLEIQGNKKVIGLYGRFEQEILEAYGAAHPDVWAAELEIEPFFKALEPLYQNLPKFPSLKEDISFYLDPEFLAGEVISELRKSDKLISKIDLLDVFEGAKGHSLTLGFEFLHPERTLTKEEASRVRSKLIKLLESKFRARVRKE